MIHVKTTTGEAVINEQNVSVVEYNREKKSVLVVLHRRSSGGQHRYKIENVESYREVPFG